MYINLRSYYSQEEHRGVVLSAIVRSIHREEISDAMLEGRGEIVQPEQIKEYVTHRFVDEELARSAADDDRGQDGVSRDMGHYFGALGDGLEQAIADFERRRDALIQSAIAYARD